MQNEMQDAEFPVKNEEEEEIKSSDSDVQGEGENEKEIKSDKTGTAHLTSSVPRAAVTPKGAMTNAQLREARELFPELSDREIHKLFKKVTN